jgi:hypothetical protein
VKFVVMILESIGTKVELPITIYCDNVGAIFMADYAAATAKTKHVGARYHYVREFIEEGFIRVVFVRSVDNKSGMFTKNVSIELYERHKQEYIIGLKDVEMIWNVEGRVSAG